MTLEGRTTPAPVHRRTRRAAVALAVVAAAIYYSSSSVRLDAQGPYYDELHQAPGAFAWKGAQVPFFALVEVRGVPLLNMTYSGAMKSALFGLYLRWSGAAFTIESWRLAGILVTIAGIVGFLLLVAGRVPTAALVLFVALLLTDANFLLLSRFDLGPVVLAFALRMLLLAAWLRALGAPRPTASMFALGALVGLCVFEKLSAVVLAVPLAILTLSSAALRARRSLAAAAAGLAAGGIPLVVVNAITWARERRLVSLSLDVPAPHRTLRTFADHLWSYVALAPGASVRAHALDLPIRPAAPLVEGGALLLLALVIASAARSSPSPWARRARALLGAWAGIGVALFFLPAITSAHHWILGTPFQYLGVGTGALALVDDARARAPWARTRVAVFAAALLGMAAVRTVGIVETERALLAGRMGRDFHHDYIALGEFGRATDRDTAFIASDWGVATQLYCYANGRPDHVFEPFWGYGGVAQLEGIAARKRVLYVVRPEPPYGVSPASTRAIEHDVKELPGWHEAELDAPLARLATLRVRKYVRDAHR